MILTNNRTLLSLTVRVQMVDRLVIPPEIGGDSIFKNLISGVIVEPRGLEPLASCMPCKRSPS